MPEVEISTEITQEDTEAALAVGASGAEVIAFAIHRSLDEQGVPREGRVVEVTAETIGIELPSGWWMKGSKPPNPFTRD